jgi:phospholipid/cholesterol/gamma-HCH transport system substrate-binding protein
MKRSSRRIVVVTVTVALLVMAGLAVKQVLLRPMTITAYFPAATAIYPGDDVRVAGVKVGTITSIEPAGTQAKLELKVDRGVPIPADAKAVIVANNLIAARYVQLTPTYRSNGPTMSDGSVIPVERTASPVEWDEVKDQLMRLATDLGPHGDMSSTSVGRFIDSAANAMGGNGEKLRSTLAELSATGRILANSGTDIVGLVKNLQTFVTALRDSGEQLVQFQGRLATLSNVLDDSKSDLDATLTNLSVAVGEVQRFVAGSRDQASEQIRRLANVTQVLSDQRMSVENLLHVAPNAFANAANIYNPDLGTFQSSFVLNNTANLSQFVCGAIGGIENATSPETAKLCNQYLGPTLNLFKINDVPIPINPYLDASASPENIIYSDPSLAPGGSGPTPGPAERPPAVSAYTGGVTEQPDAPAPAPPELLPVAPPTQPLPSASTLPELLLPAEAPAGTPQPASGTP